MLHALDNPVWHALIGPHADLARGSGLARHYPRDVAPFSAVADPSAAAYSDLAVDLPEGLEARLFRPAAEALRVGWEMMSARPIIQMIADNDVMPDTDLCGTLTTLGRDDANDMLALTEQANPGPFGARAHLLGCYVGYRDRGRLLAMGGERIRLPGLVELSAICVHRDVRGRGLGAAITSHLARAAQRRGETPFLHVFPENPAVALYQRVGFRERTRLDVIWSRPIAGARR
jgi:ribosomal protein S18 acetylase RimI-like enzyme